MTHLVTKIDDGKITIHEPGHEQPLAYISWQLEQRERPWLVEYQGRLDYVHGRRFKTITAAEHAVYVEYLERI